jgi:hypothetical protein
VPQAPDIETFLPVASAGRLLPTRRVNKLGWLSAVTRNINNPSEVVVVSRVRDLQEALGFFRDPEVRARMGQAGGGVPPEVLHLDDVAEKTY